MKMMITFFSACILVVANGFTQNATAFEKECRLAGGGGFANGFGNAWGRPDIWLQMNYRLSGNFSIATEFEDLSFGRPTFYDALRNNEKYNKQGFYDDYVSFLIKYHVPLKSVITATVSCGWSYVVRRVAYYRLDYYNGGMSVTLDDYSRDGFSIPMIAEVSYPVTKIFQVVARTKYNLNSDGIGSTYAAGLGLSMKL